MATIRNLGMTIIWHFVTILWYQAIPVPEALYPEERQWTEWIPLTKLQHVPKKNTQPTSLDVAKAVGFTYECLSQTDTFTKVTHRFITEYLSPRCIKILRSFTHHLSGLICHPAGYVTAPQPVKSREGTSLITDHVAGITGLPGNGAVLEWPDFNVTITYIT